MIMDTLNNRYYVSLIHNYKLMFVVLNYTDGNQVAGTNRHISVSDCTAAIVFKMYKANHRVFTSADCGTSTLFVYDISTDKFLDTYESVDTTYYFRYVYFSNSKIYFNGFYKTSFKSTWIAMTALSKIDVIPSI